MSRRGMVPLLLIGLLLVGLSLAVVLVAGLLAPAERLEAQGAEKFSRICDVQVYNGFLQSSAIQSASCRTGNRCYLNVPQLSIFSDDVRVRLEVGDADVQSGLMNLDEGKSYTVRVSACSSSNVGRLTLLDEKGQQSGDAKGVSFA